MRKQLHLIIVVLVLLTASCEQPAASPPPDLEERIRSVENGLTLVALGALIVRVGNSGNSEAPHLHLHVQSASEAGLPFRFRSMQRKRWLFWTGVTNGYLIRNDWFRGRCAWAQRWGPVGSPSSVNGKRPIVEIAGCCYTPRRGSDPCPQS
ncbi:MAG TPA: hypothetical protein VM366_13770 [Anaerolineae bacterium]|nr:hypothetical protein [Anaerolineae bacterium]